MNIEQIYKDANALLEGHFKLSSGNHSQFYLQSAKVLEDPKTAKLLAEALALEIKKSGIKIDAVCAPALGGLIAGFALADFAFEMYSADNCPLCKDGSIAIKPGSRGN